MAPDLLDAARWVCIVAGIALAITAALHLRDWTLHRATSGAGRAAPQQTAAVVALGWAGVYVAVEEGLQLGGPFVPHKLPMLLGLSVLGLWALLSRKPWEDQ